ncbi:hypothetical protein ACLOJK_011275 [Asimina triloba]
MAYNPGPLTEWPWQGLGNFKYMILAPFVARSVYSYTTKGSETRDLSNFMIFPLLLSRWIHNQIWVSISRFQAARSKHRIVEKGFGFEQVDREENWDDQILLSGIFLYLVNWLNHQAKNLPIWRTDGMVIIALLHMLPVEFLYYWLHRALHHHYLYSRYHSHHHSSIATEPITSVIHPFAELLSYFALFAIPLLTTTLTGTSSIISVFGYFAYIDLMNNMGHCNFEMVPRFLFTLFPTLKYLMYTPSFHSLHHTQFRTNYSLFLPIYDYIYGTWDASSDIIYESSLRGKEEKTAVVHLTHPTTPHSIYHLRLGVSWIASRPYASKWYMWIMWPMTWGIALLMGMSDSAFVVERNKLNKLKMQTWAIPRYAFQGGELNKTGEIYLLKHPQLKIRIVDGTALTVAVVLNSIPEGTKQVMMIGCLSKTGYNIIRILGERGVQVSIPDSKEFAKVHSRLPANLQRNVVRCSDREIKVCLVGYGLTKEDQKMAPKGTLFVPFSQFPPKKLRPIDCIYYSTPAMVVPPNIEDMHTCENWLPRKVMSAWRVSGIVHALEGWDAHECGDTLLNVEQVWQAALGHGFRPLPPRGTFTPLE